MLKSNFKIPNKFLKYSNKFRILTTAKKIFIPIKQFANNFATIVVNVGDEVNIGDVIAKCDFTKGVIIHSSVSGVVSAIKSMPIVDKHFTHSLVVEITTNATKKQQLSYFEDDIDQYFKDVLQLSFKEFLKKIYQSGIIGMGGGGYPAHLKLANIKQPKCLVVNLMQSEPDVYCDTYTAQKHFKQCAYGIFIIMHQLNLSEAIVATKANFIPEKLLEYFESISDNEKKIKLQIMSDGYVNGYESAILENINMKLTINTKPIYNGIVVFNILTIKAIADALLFSKPLIDRTITLVGDLLPTPINLQIKIGTPIRHILEYLNLVDKNIAVRLSGTLMGYDIEDYQISITKNIPAILVNKKNKTTFYECIRCGKCNEVCPKYLLPQQLYWYTNSKNIDKLNYYNLAECIECGLCDYVCPSKIPLVKFFEYAKNLTAKELLEQNKAKVAKERYEFRNARLERYKIERQQMLEQKRAQIKGKMATNDLEKIRQAMDKVKKTK